MFTVEIKINGTPVVVVYGHNNGYINGITDVCDYTYQVFQPNKGEKSLQEGNLQHSRDDGIITLVTQILKEVEE